MDIFKNNLTFALVGSEGSWRTDITARYIQHWIYTLNNEIKPAALVRTDTIDQALETARTDYLLVQTAGSIIFTEKFLQAMASVAEQGSDMVLGTIRAESDYITLDPSCFFINVPLWRAAGCPKFHSSVREGPALAFLPGQDRPVRLQPASADRTFVNSECASSGAELLIRQLELHGTARALLSVADAEDFFFLDASSPYHEIHSETIFEKRYLAQAARTVRVAGEPECAAAAGRLAQVIVAPAHGLRPFMLMKMYSASHVIVYSSSPAELDFQRKIFSVSAPYLYSEIVEQFAQENPSCTVVGDISAVADLPINPARGCTVEFVQADAFSFEIENVISDIDDQLTVFFDFSDVFVNPHSFWRRPLYQVQGLFAQVYSLIKSRRGPSRAAGLSPEFFMLDSLDINTSSKQFDPQALAAVSVEPQELDAVTPPLIWAPATSAAPEPAIANYKNF